MIVAGEAKSHCVAWTVEDLLAEIRARDPRLAERIVLLDDCTSPVVVPGVVDFTDAAEAAYARFAAAGMRRAVSTDADRGQLTTGGELVQQPVGDGVEEDAGAVGADAVEAEAGELLQLRGLVHDPGGELQARRVDARRRGRRSSWLLCGITSSQPASRAWASTSSGVVRPKRRPRVISGARDSQPQDGALVEGDERHLARHAGPADLVDHARLDARPRRRPSPTRS